MKSIPLLPSVHEYESNCMHTSGILRNTIYFAKISHNFDMDKLIEPNLSKGGCEIIHVFYKKFGSGDSTKNFLSSHEMLSILR